MHRREDRDGHRWYGLQHLCACYVMTRGRSEDNVVFVEVDNGGQPGKVYVTLGWKKEQRLEQA